MNSKISKVGAVVLTALLFGTAFFVPAGSVKIEYQNNINYENDFYSDEVNLEPFELDRSYVVDPIVPLNADDNDDAGYKRDAGDEQSRSNAIFPGEMEDNWPGRGRTAKLSEYDDEDWYFFSVCDGQQIDITMTPPTGHDYDIGLWDRDEVERQTSTNTGSATETISYTADYTGYWYFRVHFISGTDEGQYTFDVDLIGQNDASSGNDAGDDFATATSISQGVHDGYLDMNDEEDWYKFNANSGQGIHFYLEVNTLAYLSDYDIYLYDPSGNLEYYESYYYDDEILYPADETGEWRVRVVVFPGYTDIPDPVDWEYWTYGSGAYQLDFSLEASAPDPPGPIPQPDITPIAHTFKVTNAPGSNEDEYGYLASIPACNYLDGGDRYLAPIVYTGDSTPTNWFGTVDDTTDYLLDDWNVYLADKGKTAVEFYVDSDPIKAAAEIATEAWASSNMAVVAVDGSVYEDVTTEVLHESKTLKRNAETTTLPNDSPDFIDLAGFYAHVMTLGSKWGAINITIDGDNEEPALIGVFPHYMQLATDWWPEDVEEKYDIYYPITTMGIWAAGVASVSQFWNMKITKLECDRYTIDVDDPDSVLLVDLTTTQPSDLIVFLVDPEGNVRAPDIPDWNGGPINPIHEWNGIDDPTYPPECDQWRTWDVEPHNDMSVEVLHPEKGKWTAIVVPRYATGEANIEYTISGKIREVNPKRANAAVSAANAAVIASQEHVPLLYVTEDDVPTETQDAFDALGVTEVIFVQRGGIGSGVESKLPTKVANLKTMQEIVDYIKDYSHSENYIAITSLKSGDGYFAPTAMIAAYHCAPVFRITDAGGTTSGTNRVFIGLIGDNMYAYDLESQEFVWSDPEGWIPEDPNSDPPENSVYLGSTDDTIYCMNPEDWSFVWGNPMNYVNTITSYGSLYLSLDDKDIHCIEQDTGNEIWDYPVSNGVTKSPAQMANQIDTWRLWDGDYYHGNRAPGHLPTHDEPVEQIGGIDLLIELLKFLRGEITEIPPLGLDAKRYWNAEMHDGLYNYINSFGLDLPGQEAYLFVAPRKDIRIELHSSFIGENSYAGHIPGDTPAYSNDIIIRNILYPAIIFANPNADVTTTQLMNYPDGGTWTTNDGVTHAVYSSRVLKNSFMSHGRTFDGRILWESHLERMNDGVSVFYYSGHGTGGSGMSAQWFQTDFCNYPEIEWYDSWRGYMFDNWKTPRDNGRRWYNPEPPNLYDFIHYKWIDQLLENLRSAGVFYMSCSTGQQFGPLVYLDHGAVVWYGNAGSGLCPQADLLDDWFFDDALINGYSIGEAYSKYVWLHHRDFTIPEGDPHFDESMYGPSSLYGGDGITTIHCIYGDPSLILYSPEWSSPTPVDSPVTQSNNKPPLAPDIDGPSMGKPNTEYTFTFVTTDPDGDDIYYFVDWGDGDTEDWDGPFNSGTGSSAKHTWSSKGVYNVKVKAKDEHNLEGPWGVLQINVPRAREYVFLQFLQYILERFPILQLLLGKLLNL